MSLLDIDSRGNQVLVFECHDEFVDPAYLQLTEFGVGRDDLLRVNSLSMRVRRLINTSKSLLSLSVMSEVIIRFLRSSRSSMINASQGTSQK